jgi:hypothetical protein
MFDTRCESDAELEDALDWARIERELRQDNNDRTHGNTLPSGLFALEIDTDTQCEDGLTDAQLIDAMVGFERLTAWAQARQARLLAEFARRRPGDDPTLLATDKPCTMSRYTPDEVGLALKLARGTAKARLGRSVQLEQVLPETLALWQQGRLDERRVAAICDATHYLPEAKARAVQHRVLDRAPAQTVGQLKEALKRAILAVDPEGAAARHKAARRDRRVSIGEEHDGMASLWALLSAPDAQSCYHWLTRLAHGYGTDDPRGIDARRADLLVDLLTGRLTWAAPDADQDGSDSQHDTDTEADTATDDRTDPEADSATGGSDGAGSDDDVGPRADTNTGTEAGADTEAADAGTTVQADTDDTTGTAPEATETDSSDPDTVGADADESGNRGTAGSGTTDCGTNRSDAAGAGASTPPGNQGGGGGSPPQPVNPGKPLVQVLMPFSTLIGKDDQPCELIGYGAIPADLAREIAADATLKRLVYDELSGTVLDYGRTTYRPPAGLADHVRARDVHCRSPICRRRALDAHLDHIEPYPKGPTNDKNLHGCCGHDHQMKHAPGWAVRALPDGRIQWITPTGHRYHSYPYDYRTDGELPPDKAPKRRDLPKDLARRLERIERDRRSAALWNGETIAPDDEDEHPPF